MSYKNNGIDIKNLFRRKQIIVFDFDGVIVDTASIKSKAFKLLYEEYGHRISQMVETHHLRHSGLSRYEKFKYYHKEYLHKDLSEDEMTKLDRRFSELVVEKIVQAPLVPRFLDFLKEQYENKSCNICSCAPEGEIRKIVSLRGWSGFFSSIYGAPRTKISSLQKIINEKCDDVEDMIFLGDSETDYEAANECGVDFVGVGERWMGKSYGRYLRGFIIDFHSLISGP